MKPPKLKDIKALAQGHGMGTSRVGAPRSPLRGCAEAGKGLCLRPCLKASLEVEGGRGHGLGVPEATKGSHPVHSASTNPDLGPHVFRDDWVLGLDSLHIQVRGARKASPKVT